jgi:glycosyltransferase involved in cell wall biosynthesis
VLESNLNNSKVYFVICGSGTEFKKINEWFKRNQPKNSLLLNGLPPIKYNELLKACDIGLIFLDKRFTIPNFPSRLLSYLENKKPIVAATDRCTDLGNIIETANCGFWVESGDLGTFNKFIWRFIENPELIYQMGENSYQLLMNNYTVDISFQSIINKVK